MLSAGVPNINDRTHRYFAFAYSLTIRHDGSNSGLSACKLASSSKVARAATSAAGTSMFDLMALETNFA